MEITQRPQWATNNEFKSSKDSNQLLWGVWEEKLPAIIIHRIAWESCAQWRSLRDWKSICQEWQSWIRLGQQNEQKEHLRSFSALCFYDSLCGILPFSLCFLLCWVWHWKLGGLAPEVIYWEALQKSKQFWHLQFSIGIMLELLVAKRYACLSWSCFLGQSYSWDVFFLSDFWNWTQNCVLKYICYIK